MLRNDRYDFYICEAVCETKIRQGYKGITANISRGQCCDDMLVFSVKKKNSLMTAVPSSDDLNHNIGYSNKA